MKEKTAVFFATVFFLFMIFSSAEASSILCDDPSADNYNNYSECGCKYSDLFAGQQNSLCLSEISIMVFQEWMDIDYCLLMENGNTSWTKAHYEELLDGLGKIYNLTSFDYYEGDVCDRRSGEYFAEKYQEPYENGDCKIDGVNKFTFPFAPWDGTFVSNIMQGDLYWHFIGFMVRTEEATNPFSCCKQMFQSEDWTVFASFPGLSDSLETYLSALEENDKVYKQLLKAKQALDIYLSSLDPRDKKALNKLGKAIKYIEKAGESVPPDIAVDGIATLLEMLENIADDIDLEINVLYGLLDEKDSAKLQKKHDAADRTLDTYYDAKYAGMLKSSKLAKFALKAVTKYSKALKLGLKLSL